METFTEETTLTAEPVVKAKNSVSSPIRWSQVLALTWLSASIAVSWIAYHNFQEPLLEKFGFQHLGKFVLIAQTVILLTVPPLAGRLGDLYRLKGGNHLPVVMAGIGIVAMIFMSVATTIAISPEGIFRWLFPVLVTLWLIAMNIFHAPALAGLEDMAAADKMPVAVGLLTLITDLTYSLEPIIVPAAQSVGAPVTFAAGGILIFLSGMFYRSKMGRVYANGMNREIGARTRVSRSGFVQVFINGALLGTCVTFVQEILPDLEFTRQMNVDGNTLAAATLAITAVLAFFAGKIAVRFGWQQAFIPVVSVALLFVMFLLMPLPTWIFMPMLLGFVTATAFASVTALPSSFAELRPEHKALGIGLFLAGTELVAGLMRLGVLDFLKSNP